jgi:hypothetical protein
MIYGESARPPTPFFSILVCHHEIRGDCPQRGHALPSVEKIGKVRQICLT